jgi:hypothetical protein
MAKDLTNSQIDRQNILNNEHALKEFYKNFNIPGILFEGQYRYTKEMVADFFEVDIRTIERYINTHIDEFNHNGYEIIKGNRLKNFRQALSSLDVPDINVGNISDRTPQLSIFNFKSFINLSMLLVESQNARILRQGILDIVIDFVNKKTGGSTKYINQRDQSFISAFFQNENYRKDFTDALKNYVDMGNGKYPFFTNKIYQSIFKEKSKEYRKILNLSTKDKIRKTLYSEVLDLVSSYECGLAAEIKKAYEQKARKLTLYEVQNIFHEFENLPHWKPLLMSARNKMASRDLALRDVIHQQLKEYITPMTNSDYDKFLGTQSDELEKLMQENQDVLKRLRDRE